ncbi:MAG: hypothetical protein HUK28_03980, partial [Methanobrevibacter sp.]|nr:hypothetical protein [Methanobrevibacter sp.]
DVNVYVKPTIIGNNIVKYFQNNTHYTIQVLNKDGTVASGQKVSLNINGVFYYRTTDAEGFATLKINLNPGTYIITVEHLTTNERISNSVTVLSTIECDNLVKYFKNDSQFLVKILDSQGNAAKDQKISININGIMYSRTTDSQGIAKLNINLAPGDYIITVKYNNLQVSKEIKVLPTIKSENIQMTPYNRKPFKITALDNNGNPLSGQHIRFNINGVFYERTTQGDGSASLNINLQPGSYIITTEYNSLLTSNYVVVENW